VTTAFHSGFLHDTAQIAASFATLSCSSLGEFGITSPPIGLSRFNASSLCNFLRIEEFRRVTMSAAMPAGPAIASGRQCPRRTRLDGAENLNRREDPEVDLRLLKRGDHRPFAAVRHMDELRPGLKRNQLDTEVVRRARPHTDELQRVRNGLAFLNDLGEGPVRRFC
jgi:hypothetical protein